MSAIIGIDPGQSGAITLLVGTEVFPAKMPATERDIWEVLMDFRDSGKIDVKAYLEKVGPMPKQGVTSVWTFSGNYHCLRMALVGLAIPFETVTPQKWQKALGCMSGGDKNVTKAKAQELFPAHRWTHATADSALIAEYGRRQQ